MATKKAAPNKKVIVKPKGAPPAIVGTTPLPFMEPMPADPASILEEEEESASPGIGEEAERKSAPGL